MNSRPLKDPVASIRQRLLNLSKRRNEPFDFTLRRYGIERFLYRLSRSPYADQFVLKGAILFTLWIGKRYRPTYDLDLLGYGDPSSERLIPVFREIISTPIEEDGLIFDEKSIRVEEIREGQVYGGQRVHLKAQLGTASISIKIDIGFGDVITPTYQKITYPTLLEFPAPLLRAYPKETVLAEKIHALVTLGILNSRLKDFYDIWAISQELSFEGRSLQRAIEATFERRQTRFPLEIPIALTEEFSQAPDRAKQWKIFLHRHGLASEKSFEQVIEEIRLFIQPILRASATGQEFTFFWPAGGPWNASASPRDVHL